MTDIRQTTQDADEAQPLEPRATDTQGPADDGTTAAVAAPALEALGEEGEVAADYLEELLHTEDLDGDIDIAVRDVRIGVARPCAAAVNRLSG